MFSKSRIPVRAILTEGALPASVQRRVYRRRGWKIAGDVEFAPGAIIDAETVEIAAGASLGLGTVVRGRHVRIGRRAQIGSFCFFEGKDITIGDDAVFREQTFVGGPLFPDSLLEVGKRVRVYQTCFLNPSKPLRIGDDTGVGGRSSIFTHGSWQSAFEGYPVTFEPVTIGRNVYLPWHVFILPGVEIGDDVTLGAGSVVNRSIPAGVLAAGVPCKVLRGPEAWPRPMEPDARWGLARNVWAQFLLHLADEAISVDAESDREDRSAARITYRGRTWRLALVRTGAAADLLDQVVVVLDGPDGASRPTWPTWFSLRDKRKGGHEDEVTRELEEWLARWGVRFAPEDEP